MDDSFDELLGTLDLEGKVRLLSGEGFFTLHGDASIGLQPMAFSDGPTGVRGVEFGAVRASLLPNATLLAASWSEETAHEVGGILAEEAERQHIHVVLGPTINLHRSTLGGRLFEAYSEDPLLTGRLAAAYVRGLQERRIGACLKHFVANESETERHTVDSRVDVRTLRELYLLPFEIAVQDAGPWSVMAAYNDVNGVPATEQGELNNGVLKAEWAWPGLLMSDWFATKSVAPAANGGLDLVMPALHSPWGAALVAAVEAGDVDVAVVDDHVRRLLRLAQRVGALGEPRAWPSVTTEPDSSTRREQLTRLAAAGMTVLRNQQQALPLPAGATVALIGRHAIETTNMGGGSAQVRAPYEVSIAEGMTLRLGDRVGVTDGVHVRTRPRAARPGFLVDPVTGAPGVRMRALSRDGHVLDDTVQDENVGLFGMSDSLDALERVELRAVVPAGSVRVGVLGIGEWTVRVGDLESSVTLSAATDDVGEAVLRPPGWFADVTLDAPTEILAEVFPNPAGGHGALGLIAEPTPSTDDDAITAAVAAATAADIAVVVVGLTEEQETETVDKATLTLPGRQDDLVAAVAAVADRTVVVVNAATPVLMPWLDDVEAVLWAGIPGQEGGHAVAAAITNDIEPTGRLVTSFPVEDGAAPAWRVEPVDGVLAYDEGTFIGYRGHAAGLAKEPAFWFGHGLGYGAWSYGTATVTGRSVSLDVTNTSGVASREVVQVYYDPRREGQPIRLVGWQAALVGPGEAQTVEVTCDERMWRTWDVGTSSWRELSGGELVVARGLGDVRQRIPLD
jgi:beta-glucosidase